MKLVRVLSRLTLLLLVAAAFVGLTWIYASYAYFPLPSARWREGRDHRPSAPKLAKFDDFLAAVVTLAFFTGVGRIALRLRLSPPPRREEPISLDLREGGQGA